MSAVRDILEEGRTVEGGMVWLSERAELPTIPGINWNRAYIAYGHSGGSGGYPIFLLLPATKTLPRRALNKIQKQAAITLSEVSEFAELDIGIQYDETARTYYITFWVE